MTMPDANEATQHSLNTERHWSELVNQVAVVTGATGWLGNPISLGLAHSGASVVITSRSPEKLNVLARTIKDLGHKAFPIKCDLTVREDVESLVEKVQEEFGRLDILVNNAVSVLSTNSNDDFSDLVRQSGENLSTVWQIIEVATQLLKDTAQRYGDASIINIASMYGKISPDHRIYENSSTEPNPIFYGTSKAGIIQMTRWLACKLGPFAIRVNSVSPGPFPRQDLIASNSEFGRLLEIRSPLGRIGRPNEISGVVTFLASQGATYITGADIAVDGGWTSW